MGILGSLCPGTVALQKRDSARGPHPFLDRAKPARDFRDVLGGDHGRHGPGGAFGLRDQYVFPRLYAGLQAVELLLNRLNPFSLDFDQFAVFGFEFEQTVKPAESRQEPQRVKRHPPSDTVKPQ